MKFKQAYAHAIKAGATPQAIEREIVAQRRFCRTIPQRNMVRALKLMPWINTADDWARLAGALAPKAKA